MRGGPEAPMVDGDDMVLVLELEDLLAPVRPESGPAVEHDDRVLRAGVDVDVVFEYGLRRGVDE